MAHERILPTDVLAELEKRGQATRAELAESLECSEETISRKVAVLIKDGENIGFDKAGLFVQHKEDASSKDGADRARIWMARIINSLKMWAQRGNNQKAVAIEARKRFASELTREERNRLKGNLLLIGRVVDAVNLDEELQE